MAGTLNGSGLPAGTAAPTWRRFAWALVVSAVLHGVAVFGVRAGIGEGWGATGEHRFLTARLMPVPNEKTPQHNPGPAPATVIALSPDGRPAPVVADPAKEPPPPATAAGAGSGPNLAGQHATGTGSLPFDYLKTGHYFPARHVHKPPAAIGDINFEYPANTTIRDGVVFAQVLINARGNVDMVIVDSAEPAGVFDNVAVRDLLDAKFSPGLMHGVPVPTELMVEIRYKDPGGSFIPGANITLKNR